MTCFHTGSGFNGAAKKIIYYSDMVDVEGIASSWLLLSNWDMGGLLSSLSKR